MSKTHAEESLGANPGDAALNPADSVAMGVPSSRAPRAVERARLRAFVALRHREYRLLFAAFLINQIGFWISHISLQGLMVALTDNDAPQSGLLFFAIFIPASVCAPLAGVVADYFDRKRIVIVCYVMVAGIVGTLAMMSARATITPNSLLALSLLLGIYRIFGVPLEEYREEPHVGDAFVIARVSCGDERDIVRQNEVWFLLAIRVSSSLVP